MVKVKANFILLRMDIQFSWHHLLKILPFLCYLSLVPPCRSLCRFLESRIVAKRNSNQVAGLPESTAGTKVYRSASGGTNGCAFCQVPGKAEMPQNCNWEGPEPGHRLLQDLSLRLRTEVGRPAVHSIGGHDFPWVPSQMLLVTGTKSNRTIAESTEGQGYFWVCTWDHNLLLGSRSAFSELLSLVLGYTRVLQLSTWSQCFNSGTLFMAC